MSGVVRVGFCVIVGTALCLEMARYLRTYLRLHETLRREREGMTAVEPDRGVFAARSPWDVFEARNGDPDGIRDLKARLRREGGAAKARLAVAFPLLFVLLFLCLRI